MSSTSIYSSVFGAMFSLEKLKSSNHTFIIAEVGQNHQGDINLAKQLIKAAHESGADCAKFQKTCLEEKFNNAALKRPYSSPNSFGSTYGDHKAFLEFSEAEFKDLQKYAKEMGIFFTASAMDEKSLDFLADIHVPFIKIGSGDANNFLLIEKAAKKGIPLIISTGMQTLDTIKRIYQLVSKHHKQFALLHCVSAYPTPYEDVNLTIINLFKENFPDVIIGYSGHELGIHISAAAVALGSKIIERHITLDKTQKGSDHNCSLEPQEFRMLVDNIRTLEKAMGQPNKIMQTSEMPCYKKLGKTLVYTQDLPKGHKLDHSNIKIKVAEPKGIDGAKFHEVVGKTLTADVKEDQSILVHHLNKFI